VGLPFVSATCVVFVLVVSGLRRFGFSLSAAYAVSTYVFSGLHRFGFFVVSGLRRFGFLVSAAFAVLVRFCFVSITLIPAALAIVFVVLPR